MEFQSSFCAGRLSSAFTADELEVAGILLDLAGKFDVSGRFPPSWGAKRRRSVIDNPPPVTGKSDYSSNSPDSPLLFASPVDSGSNRSLPKTLQVRTDSLIEFRFDFRSTPLTNCPLHTTKRDELLMDLGRLTETREYLKLEVKRTKLSRDELMAENMKLQETEQLMHERVYDGSDPLELRLTSQAGPSGFSQSEEVFPKGIVILPDLNAPADEFLADVECPQPSDSSRLQAAAAARGGAEAAALARQHRRLVQMNKRGRRGGR